MPAKSKAQQKAAGAALSAKRGDTPKSKLKGASKQMVDSMSEKQLEDFAKARPRANPNTRIRAYSAASSSAGADAIFAWALEKVSTPSAIAPVRMSIRSCT